MTVTRDDVARTAGVSVATVSYVLNRGPKPVSEDKRRRVMEAVTTLGYRPNAIASSLRARRTHILGLVVPDTTNPYFARLSHAIEDAAAARGYQTVISNAGDDPERESAQIEAQLRLQIDGLIWIPDDLQRDRPGAPIPLIPTVLVDRAFAQPISETACDVIESDNHLGGRLAAAHVAGLGHRVVAFLSGPAGHLHTEQRLLGARETLAAAGIPLPPTLVAHGDFSYSAGARSGRAWLTLPAGERPTAIVCANDAMAIGVLSAVASLGLRVPEDVSVTGYDDVPQAQFTVPPLTTVAQPLDEMAEEAIVRLLGRIECPADAPPTYHYIFPVRLIERSSSARLRSVAPSG